VGQNISAAFQVAETKEPGEFEPGFLIGRLDV
jgi:hypothetical protein